MISAPVLSDLSLHHLGFGTDPDHWSRPLPRGGWFTVLRCDDGLVVSRFNAAGLHRYTFTFATAAEFERWVADQWSS